MAKRKQPTIDEHTVQDVIRSVNPAWEKIETCFNWPADVFLITSFLLKKSGGYRNTNLISRWKSTKFLRISDEADEWNEAIQVSLVSGRKPKLPPGIKTHINQLQKGIENTEFNRLKVLNDGDAATEDLMQLIMYSHILADEACANSGLPGIKSTSTALVSYLANLLLIGRGTMSSAPKYHGIVVPKMRTPQTGITVRSFSQHVSYHDTEVEVMWRSVPWMNKDQNTLNILAVPWPKIVKASDFSCSDDTFEKVRFFEYEKTDSQKEDIGKLVSLIKKTSKEYRIHIVAFPEMGLTVDEYSYFLKLLKQEFESGKDGLETMPMVVAGVNEIIKKKPNRNMVKLAIYFAGKWYDMSQTKHHRWKMNRSQLMQYELAGRFSTERDWFEGIKVEQRRLSFFVPNAWLALCPLICEDLAQLDPVSEVIRGMGPTLLFALLMDGPQLKERWPARYASVFADDPGTAVLTMTSIGMMNRSKKLHDDTESGRSSKSFALWKDQVQGWRTIDGIDRDKKNVALLSISASFIEELTADGRGDGGFAASFKLDGVIYPEDEQEQCTLHETAAETNKESIWYGDWLDLRELSTTTFAIDVLISLRGDHWNLIRFWNAPRDKDPGSFSSKDNYHYSYLVKLLINSYQNPNLSGIKTETALSSSKRKKTVSPSSTVDPKDAEFDDRRTKWPTPSLQWAMEQLEELNSYFADKRFDGIPMKNSDKQDPYDQHRKEILRVVGYWRHLFEVCESSLKKKNAEWKTAYSTPDQDRVRIERAVFLVILSALHNRLDYFRMKYNNLDFESIASLLTKVEDAIFRYNRLESRP